MFLARPHGLTLLLLSLLILAALPTHAQDEPAIPVRLFTLTGADLPAYVDSEGLLFLPSSKMGDWQPAPLEGRVHDLYTDSGGYVWTATEEGLFLQTPDGWQFRAAGPLYRLRESHGYFYALGDGFFWRALGGNPEAEFKRYPLPDAQAQGVDYLMLGNHNHVVLNAETIFLTPDLGLTWQAFDQPAPISYLTTDNAGNLFADSAEGVLRWDFRAGTWSDPLPLPDAARLLALREVESGIYGLGDDGQLYRLAGAAWENASPPELSAPLISMTRYYPATLFLLSADGLLWRTTDGQTWESLPLSPV